MKAFALIVYQDVGIKRDGNAHPENIRENKDAQPSGYFVRTGVQNEQDKEKKYEDN